MLGTRTRYHRRARASASLIVAALALSACGADDTGTGDDTGEAAGSADLLAGATASPSSLSGTIQVWGWSTGPQYADILLPEFNKVYPNIRVEMKTIAFPDYAAALRPALASDSGPDVFQLQPGALTSQFGRFGVDLAPLAEEVLGPDWDTMVASAGVDAFTTDDMLTALPVGLQAAGTLVYNKTMLDEYGLTPPQSLSEWEDLCATLKSKNKECFAHGGKDQWVNQDVLQAIANSIAPGQFSKAVEGEIEWSDPDLVEALTVWGDLFHNGIMQPGAVSTSVQPEATYSFLTGEAAMMATGTWGMLYYKNDVLAGQMEAAGVSDPKPFTALLMDFPSVTGTETDPGLFGGVSDGMAVSAESKNKAAAAAFVQWLTLTTDGQETAASPLTALPSLSGASPALDGLVDETDQRASFDRYNKLIQDVADPRAIAYPDLVTALGNSMQAIATGQRTPEQAAADIEEVSRNISR